MSSDLKVMWVFAALFYLNVLQCHGKSSDLPAIFHIDDYESCKTELKTYCKVRVVLHPLNNSTKSNTMWQRISALKNEKTSYYRHDELFHAICVENFCQIGHKLESADIKQQLGGCYGEKYEDLGLAAQVTWFKCTDNDSGFPIRLFDVFFLFCIIIYLALIGVASFGCFHNRVLQAFCVRENLCKLKNDFQSQNNGKLNCIQGIRFYNMCLIIFCHTYCSYIGGYVVNTEYFEMIENSFWRHFVRNSLVFLVHTFFLFSAFFLSSNIFALMDKRKFSLKLVILAMLHRYLRILPPVVIMVGLGSSIWIVNSFKGPVKDLYSDVEYERCQINWWTTLLFISNHYNHQDMCYFITWYLSADTQLYGLSLIILSLIWLRKTWMKRIIFISVLLGIICPVIVSSLYDVDYIYKITPENSKNGNFRSFNFNAVYTATYSNMATYMVGLIFGFIYYKKQSMSFLLDTVLSKAIWMAVFFGLPALVIILTFNSYPKWFSPLLSGILKPCFAAGIAVGVFGMIKKNGGLIRKICEWKFAVFLGNFTFSTYMVHYGIVFARTATTKQLMFVSDYILITSYIRDVILSFLCGFLMHLLVELPMGKLQAYYLPQVRCKHNTLQRKANQTSKSN